MDHATFDPASIFSAKDLVVVITGGGTGIGLAFAAALVKTGAAKVYILGRRQSVLDDAAASLNASISAGSDSTTVEAVHCDVADLPSITRAAAHVRAATGYVDVLINNAGIAGPNHKAIHTASSIAELQRALLGDWQLWAPTLAVNTAAVTGVTGAFLDLLDAANVRRGYVSGKLERGQGARERNVASSGAAGAAGDPKDLRTAQVITVASIAAFNRFVTAGTAYSASKAGAVATAKSLATFLAPWGIRSNVIAPGIFPSEMTEGVKAEFPYDEVPAQRQGTFDEIAGTLLYMVGKSGAYLNGSVQVADGGRLSIYPGTY